MSNTMLADKSYQLILSDCLNGEKVVTRGHTCYRTIGMSATFHETPLVCLRKTSWKNCLREWEWFMSGSDTIDDLDPRVRHWWEPFADDGRVLYNYGVQFRDFKGHSYVIHSLDQIDYLVHGIKDHPHSRRNVITTWNTADMAEPGNPLTNCHGTVIQAFVTHGKLSLLTYQRSVDVIVGLPHNWLQYWAFLLWLSHKTGLEPSGLTWIGGDIHVYEQHLDLAGRILSQRQQVSPKLVYKSTNQDFLACDFRLEGDYKPAITEYT